MLINGKDLGTWGCCLEDGDPFLIPHPIKPFPRNDNRLKHGVDMLRDAPRFDTKEFTLVFGFGSGNDLTQRINDFVMEIYKGGNVMYYKGVTAVVDYLSCTEFESINEVGKLAVRFESNSPFVKETATGYGTINLPNNVLSGVADVKVQGVTVENKLKNSSLADDVDRWYTRDCDVTIKDGYITLTSKATNAYLFQLKLFTPDTYAYRAVAMRAHTDRAGIFPGSLAALATHSGSGEWEALSAVSKITNIGMTQDYHIKILDAGVSVDVKLARAVDLTQAFGAGNEPTKEQYDLMFPNWFDGTRSVRTPMRVRGIGANVFNDDTLRRNKYVQLVNYKGRRCARIRQGRYADTVIYAENLSTQVGWSLYYNMEPEEEGGTASVHVRFNDGTSELVKMENFTEKPLKRSYSAGYRGGIRKITPTWGANEMVYHALDDMAVVPIGASIEPYVESNLYIKTKAQLESVGATKDFIKDGLLHKNIKDGAVLDKPITTPIQTSGQVVAHPNGSIFIDPIVAVAGIYTDKAGIPDSSLPLLQLDELMVIDHETGREERLDVSKAVITESSFTHPDLKEGDTVFFEYYYDLNPIYGLNEVEYLNSNVVTKEMANKGLIK